MKKPLFHDEPFAGEAGFARVLPGPDSWLNRLITLAADVTGPARALPAEGGQEGGGASAIAGPAPAALAAPTGLQTSVATAADFRFVVTRSDDGKATAVLQQRTVTVGPNGQTTETWDTARTAQGAFVSQSNAGWDDTIPWAQGNSYELTSGGPFAGAPYSWDMLPKPTGRFDIKLHQGSVSDPSSALTGCIGVTVGFLTNAHNVLQAAGVLDSAIQLQVIGNFDYSFTITRSTANLEEGSAATFTIALTGPGAAHGVTKDIWLRLDLDPAGPGFAAYNKDPRLGDYTITPTLPEIGGINYFDASAPDAKARYAAGVYVLLPKWTPAVTYTVSTRAEPSGTPAEPNETINLAITDYFVMYRDGTRYSDTLTQPGVLLNGGIPATTITLQEISLLTDDHQSGDISGYQHVYHVLVGDKVSYSFDAFSIPDTLVISNGASSVGTGGPISGVRSGSFTAVTDTITVTVIGSAVGTAWDLTLHADRTGSPAQSPPEAAAMPPARTQETIDTAGTDAHSAAPAVPVAVAVPGATLQQLASLAVTIAPAGTASVNFQAKANTNYLVLLAGEGAGAAALADGYLKLYNIGDAAASIEVHDSDIGGAPASFFRSATDATIRIEAGSDLAGRGGSATVEIFDASLLGAPVVFIAPGRTFGMTEGGDLEISVPIIRIGDVSQAASYRLGIAGQGANPLAASDLQGGFGDIVVQFAAGQSRASARFVAIGDSLAEGIELGTVFIRPESLPAQSLLNAQALGLPTSATISVEDKTFTQGLIFPGVTLAGGSVVEGGTLNFLVTLSRASDHAISIGYATVDSSAQTGMDYSGVSGTLLFAPGETAKTIAIATVADTLNEASEAFILSLVNPIGTAFVNGVSLLSANGTIQNIQAIIGTGAAETLTGNDSPNLIDGAAGNDTLLGNGGNDFLFGGPGNDRLDGGAGDDSLNGGGGNDTMLGGSGNDVLTGGNSASTMSGGAGNDTYYVFDTSDAVIELAGEGVDRIAASVNYTLLAGSAVETLEAITLSATTALNFAGNALAQTLIGNAGANTLTGGGGNDTMLGLGGNDVLIGSSNASAMYGGAGNDTYYVSDTSDAVIEAAGEGIDRIAASVSYTLLAGSAVETLEAITLSATTALSFTGNAFNNTIIGNNGANILTGGGGNDTMIGAGGNDLLIGGNSASAMFGGTGDDTYYVSDTSDAVIEAAGEGADRIAASVSYVLAGNAEVEIIEAVNLGATTALNFTGSNFGNAITGNAGANVLDGKGGNDVLAGYLGADTFAFTSALGAGNVDQIVDFAHGTDKIALDDAVFAGLTPGALAASAFVVGSAAADADDRIVYNSATGQLFFDADGSGAGAMVQFATLTGTPTLTASDFVVI